MLVKEKFCKTALTGTNFQYHLLGDLMVDDDWTETGESRRDIKIENLLLSQKGHVNATYSYNTTVGAIFVRDLLIFNLINNSQTYSCEPEPELASPI